MIAGLRSGDGPINIYVYYKGRRHTKSINEDTIYGHLSHVRT